MARGTQGGQIEWLEGVTPCPRDKAHLGMKQWAAVITHLGHTRKPPQTCSPSSWMEAMKGREWGAAAFPPMIWLPWVPGGCRGWLEAGVGISHPGDVPWHPSSLITCWSQSWEQDEGEEPSGDHGGTERGHCHDRWGCSGWGGLNPPRG